MAKSKKKKQKEKSMLEVYESIRRDWGDLNPVTRVMENKKRKKPKHKEREYNYEDEV